MRTLVLLLLASCMVVAACSGNRTQTEGNTSGGTSVIIVRGAELGAANVLDGLRTRIPNMTVTTLANQCPRISFRGQRTMRAPGNPSVYVDGTLVRDTCVLQQIPGFDVELVEVSPSGNSARPGIARNPEGVIVVVRRRV
jgi:hypothetical protein